MSEDPRRYVSYLLRLWQTQHAGVLVWRASLQSASDSGRCQPVRVQESDGIGIGRPGERRGFASLAELFAFLEEATAPAGEAKPCPPPKECQEEHLGVGEQH